MSRASREEAEELRAEMVAADVALFTGLGHYWTGMARVLQAGLEDQESDGLRQAAPMIDRALEQMRVVRSHEERMFSIAEPIEYSAYFVRRHEVVSQDTEALAQGLEAMSQDLAEGYYPAEACAQLNRVMTRLMDHFEQDARIEGVLSRIEGMKPESSEP